MFGRQFDYEGAAGSARPVFFSHRLFGKHVVNACDWSRAHSRSGENMDMAKWLVTPHPLEQEKGKRKLEPTSEWLARSVKARRELLKYSNIREFRRVLAETECKELLERIPADLKEEFVHDFRNWALGIGKRSDYVKAGVPLASVGQGKPLSRHQSVIKFADRITARVADYYRELAEMKMRGPAVGKGGREATLEDLWMYFKYVVRNEPMDPDDFALYLEPPGSELRPQADHSALVGNQNGVIDEIADAPSLKKRSARGEEENKKRSAPSDSQTRSKGPTEKMKEMQEMEDYVGEEAESKLSPEDIERRRQEREQRRKEEREERERRRKEDEEHEKKQREAREKHVKEVEERVKKAKEELDKAEKERAERERKMKAERAAEEKKAREEVEKRKAELAEKEKKAAEEKARLEKEHQEKLAKLAAEREEIKKKGYAETEASKKAAEKEKARLEAEKKSAEEQAKSEVETLRAQLEAEKAKAEKALKDLNERWTTAGKEFEKKAREAYEAKQKELQKALEEKASTEKRLKEASAEWEKKEKAAKQKEQKALKEKADAEKRLKELNENWAAAGKDFTEKAREAFEAQQKQLEAALKEKQDLAAKASSEVKRLYEREAELQAEKDALIQAARNYEAERQQLTAHVKALAHSKNVTEAQLAEAHGEVKRLYESEAALMAQRDAERSQMAAQLQAAQAYAMDIQNQADQLRADKEAIKFQAGLAEEERQRQLAHAEQQLGEMVRRAEEAVVAEQQMRAQVEQAAAMQIAEIQRAFAAFRETQQAMAEAERSRHAQEKALSKDVEMGDGGGRKRQSATPARSRKPAAPAPAFTPETYAASSKAAKEISNYLTRSWPHITADPDADIDGDLRMSPHVAEQVVRYFHKRPEKRAAILADVLQKRGVPATPENLVAAEKRILANFPYADADVVEAQHAGQEWSEDETVEGRTASIVDRFKDFIPSIATSKRDFTEQEVQAVKDGIQEQLLEAAILSPGKTPSPEQMRLIVSDLMRAFWFGPRSGRGVDPLALKTLRKRLKGMMRKDIVRQGKEVIAREALRVAT